MKVIYGCRRLDGAVTGKPVSDSMGAQIVSAIIQDDNDLIVLVLDSVIGTYYIEKIKDKHCSDILRSANFEVLPEDQYIAYSRFLERQALLPSLYGE
jgi:hypothetical protein